MKRLVIIFSLLTVSMSLVSCDVLKGWKEKFFSSEDDVVGYEAEPANPYEIRIYANGYDGYVNIRQAPTTKSAVIGRLRNGNDYAVQVGVQGNWITVEYNNTIGYAHNSMVGYSAWPAVNLDVEAEWFQGAYETGYGESPSQFFIYKNGKFDMLHGQDETILPSLAMGGAQGGIGGTTNYNGCNLVGIIDAWNAGDIEKARELQNFSQEVINVICHYRGNIVCGKRIMKLIGLDLGPNRTPFQNMTDEEEAACRKELEAINFFERCNKL